jgi:hypothetical protein
MAALGADSVMPDTAVTATTTRLSRLPQGVRELSHR